MTLAYASGLTNEQWELLASQLPAPKSTGRPRTVDLHQVVNAILYVLTSSCAWYLLANDFPPYSTVYYYFRQWRDDGTWKRVHDHLVQWVRVLEAHLSTPSAASLDSQSVPTAVMVHESVGYDAAKKTKGRKRFTLVDTFGLLLSVKVVAASVPEREGATQLLHKLEEERDRFPRLVRIWVDGGFDGKDFGQWIMDTFRLIWEVVLRPEGTKGFVLLPKRWMVENIQYQCRHKLQAEFYPYCWN
ncbi:MAG: IS5 family transposase [Cyanothece sp. SIO1E1]|nr:IS5 family transposase [Cyanothece sp. SIO1E1]